MKWLNEYKWILLAIIITAIVIYYFGKKAGQAVAPKTVTLPGDIIGPGGNQFNPGPYTDGMYNDIYGGLFTPRDSTPYANALNLSDSQLVAVYNDWNNRYWAKDNETIIDALNGEHLAFMSTSFRDLRDQLVSRFQKLVSQGAVKQ